MGVLKQYGELASYGDYLNLLNTNRAKSAIKDVDNILIGLRTNGEEESSRVMGKYLKDNAVESDFVDEEHFLEVMENQDMIYF